MVATANEASSAVLQSALYQKQHSLNRSPDDVTFTPRGGVAVVRASQHFPNLIQGPQGSYDEIVLINPKNGERFNFPVAPIDKRCTPSALTEPDGAGDLVSASDARAVLIGERIWTGGPQAGEYTFVNVVDLTQVYGAGPACMLEWSKTDAGHVSDVAVTPDGRFAVVNHKGWISVFQIDGTSIPAPAEFSTSGAIPTRQRNSLAMTRNALMGMPMKCVAVTAQQVAGKRRTWAYVLELSGGVPVLEAALEINQAWPEDDNPPHDVRLTPDETMAVVCADGVVALIDLTAGPSAVWGEWRDLDAERVYENLADSLVVTNTQAVTLASERGNPSGQWQADVFDIAPGHSGGLVLKRSEIGPGAPHDIERSFDGQTVVVRSQQHVVFLDDIDRDANEIGRFDHASPSDPLSVTFGLNHESVIVSRPWVVPVLQGQPGDGKRHFAATLGHDAGQAVDATRVEIFDLTPLTLTQAQAPTLVHTEVLFDIAQGGGATPGSIVLHPGGQTFLVRCNAAPHDVDPENPPANYDPATGEDVWYFSLRDDTLGSVFQYEMTASPRSASDPTDVARYASVSISSHFTQFLGDNGYVHAIEIAE